jgi:Zn-dependent oligopeptidase
MLPTDDRLRFVRQPNHSLAAARTGSDQDQTANQLWLVERRLLRDESANGESELARIGMPREIVMRHRLPHFGHLFSGGAYAAGYYVYMWAEVLDADGFEAFVEAGNVFDPTLAERLRRNVYAAGGTLEAGAAYRAFRGRDASVEAMLAKRGLIEGQSRDVSATAHSERL